MPNDITKSITFLAKLCNDYEYEEIRAKKKKLSRK